MQLRGRRIRDLRCFSAPGSLRRGAAGRRLDDPDDEFFFLLPTPAGAFDHGVYFYSLSLLKK